jgi:cytochrome P450
VGLGDVPPEILELNASFLVMDDPRHATLRRIVSGAFTPRRVAQLEAAITAEATRIVDEFVERGSGDVVEHLSMKLPLWTIANMMGVPESMRAEFVGAAELQVAAQDPEFSQPGIDSMTLMLEAGITVHRIAAELAALRRAEPTDDVYSTLVHAEYEGEPLDDQMLGAIFLLFAVAGNDTTRNSTTHGIRFFAENPGEWKRLLEARALLPTAVEEIVRCASPVIHFRRTATEATEIAGQHITGGDAVVMFYESANRDEAVFDDPFRFDIGRDPNPHIAFGGGGPHFCLGANLARAQLRAIFARLADRVETFEAGEPAFLTSNFIHGVKRMNVVVTPR